jgi:hypothetical protein
MTPRIAVTLYCLADQESSYTQDGELTITQEDFNFIYDEMHLYSKDALREVLVTMGGDGFWHIEGLDYRFSDISICPTFDNDYSIKKGTDYALLSDVR